MIEILIWLLFSGLAFIGVITIIRSVEDKILASQVKKSIACVYPVKGHTEDAEEIMRAYHNRIQWSENECDNILIVLDMGLDEDTLELCKRLCEKYGEIMLCKPDELDAVFESKVNVLVGE